MGGAVPSRAGSAFSCAPPASGSASAAPRIIAPMPRAWILIMGLFSCLFFRVAGAEIFVLVVRAFRQGLLVLRLVALEAVAGIGLGVLLAGVGLGRVLGNLVAGSEQGESRDCDQRLHALASLTLALPP